MRNKYYQKTLVGDGWVDVTCSWGMEDDDTAYRLRLQGCACTVRHVGAIVLHPHKILWLVLEETK